MKVYIVEHAYGEFDSYHSYVGKVFLNKKSAEKYMKEFDNMHADFKPTIPEEIWDKVFYEDYETNEDDYEDRLDYNNEKYVLFLYELLTKKFGHTEYTLEDVKNMVYYAEEVEHWSWNKSTITEKDLIED